LTRNVPVFIGGSIHGREQVWLGLGGLGLGLVALGEGEGEEKLGGWANAGVD
jgi:hypothetical protein